MQVCSRAVCISCSFVIVDRISSKNAFYCRSSYCIGIDRVKDKRGNVHIPQDGGRMRGKQIPSAVFALEEVLPVTARGHVIVRQIAHSLDLVLSGLRRFAPSPK